MSKDYDLYHGLTDIMFSVLGKIHQGPAIVLVSLSVSFEYIGKMKKHSKWDIITKISDKVCFLPGAAIQPINSNWKCRKIYYFVGVKLV